MRLTGDRLWFGRGRRQSNPWRILALLLMIGAGVLLTRLVEAGKVRPLVFATPLPTRSAFSYTEQGRAYFSAGDIEAAIDAYESAVALEPANSRLWAELARIQTYSSELLTNTERRRARLAEARQSADRAIEVNGEDAFAQAVRTLVYDWSASAEDDARLSNEYLSIAVASAIRASQLDPDSPLALAYFAEVLSDQQKWVQARDLIERSVSSIESEPNAQDDTRMDIYRVYGSVLESIGYYRLAIEAYEKASRITPNLTFLYLSIGVNYRQLRQMDTALDYFNRAVQINEQLGIADPVPYLAIGKTYAQDGEFFIAALNLAQALLINPSEADIYGRLGIVFYRARNYESAIPVLQCAVEGCSAEESQALLCELGYIRCDPDAGPVEIAGREVRGLILSSDSLEYYYTYGSALAFQSGAPGYETACETAEEVFQQLLAGYGSDPIVTGIVAENRNICARAGTPPSPLSTETLSAPSGQPEATPTP